MTAAPAHAVDTVTAIARRRARARRDEIDPTPWPLALLCAVVGGAAAFAAFPPYDMWGLLPLSLTLLSAGLLVRSVWLAALVSLLWGAAFFIPLTEWANIYAGTVPWIALGIVQALYILLYGLLARTVMVRRGLTISTALVVAALWVGVETLRSHWPWGGLSWGASAFALADSPLLSLGPWIGTAGLAFAVALLGQVVLHGVLALLGRRHRGLIGFSGVWPLALAVAAVLATMVVPYPRNAPPEGRHSMTIMAIHGSATKPEGVTYQMPEGVYENHVDVTQGALGAAQESGVSADLVVWPEDSTGWDPREDPQRAREISALAADAEAPLLVGTQQAVGEDQRYNHALLYTPEGETPYVYAKRHPVPFGEYVPARDLFRRITDKVDLVGRDMLAGDEVGVMDLQSLEQGEAQVGILICFEIAYDNLVLDVVDDGAEVIVVQSNTALFGDSHEAVQQLAQAEVMAVISGRSVVHAATAGPSAIFSPEGRRLAHVDHWDQGAMIADVPLRTGITPAVAAGPWIAIGITAVGVVGWLAALGSTRRAIHPASRKKKQ